MDINIKDLTDEQLEQLTPEQTADMDDAQIVQLANRLSCLRKEGKATKAHLKLLWFGLRRTEAVKAEIRAGETLSEREDWLKWYGYNMRRNQLPEQTHDEYEEVFRLIKQPFSQMRGRLQELMNTRYWPLERSIVLHDIGRMTFPICKQDGELVDQIMRAQRERYEQFIKPYEGLPSQWEDDCEGWDDSDTYSFRLKMQLRWLGLKYRASVLNAKLNPWHKPWPPRGIEQPLSGSIYEQSPDALLQLRFTWGRCGFPELDFIPMKPLEHFRFGFNDEFMCYNLYRPTTGGGYPWCELIPILENPTGNDADWRFKEGYSFEYCLKDEPKGSSK
ncbi:MAG: hypothetical protein PHC97_04025 [Patescibacteria group bacterium]|nr:hypothetical protein [Patescibacteria group bacterium]